MVRSQIGPSERSADMIGIDSPNDARSGKMVLLGLRHAYAKLTCFEVVCAIWCRVMAHNYIAGHVVYLGLRSDERL